MKNGILGILLLSLTGCVSLDERIQREGELAGAPQNIIDAVKHGCSSGKAAGGSRHHEWKKDYNLYENDKQYKSRWDDTFQLCKGRYEDLMRSIR